MGVFDTEV